MELKEKMCIYYQEKNTLTYKKGYINKIIKTQFDMLLEIFKKPIPDERPLSAGGQGGYLRGGISEYVMKVELEEPIILSVDDIRIVHVVE